MIIAATGTGSDGVAADCLKRDAVTVVEWLVRPRNLCFVTSVEPIEWRNASVVPLYKGKGDPDECSNGRGISSLIVIS